MNRLFMATLVATCALGGQAFADEGMRGDGMRGGKMRHGAIMRMDTDKSGDVDRTEFTTAIATRAKERFDRLDTDGDGSVSEAEFSAMIADQAERRFAWLDRDDDGKLTIDDRGGRRCIVLSGARSATGTSNSPSPCWTRPRRNGPRRRPSWAGSSTSA